MTPRTGAPSPCCEGGFVGSGWKGVVGKRDGGGGGGLLREKRGVVVGGWGWCFREERSVVKSCLRGSGENLCDVVGKLDWQDEI